MRSAALVAAVLLAAPAARAHQVGLSRGVYTRQAQGVDLELVLARGEAAASVDGLDRNGDGTVDQAELDAAGDVLAREVVHRIALSVDGEHCTDALRGAHLTEADGLAVRAQYRCARAGEVTVDFQLAEALSSGHRHLAHVVDAGGERDLVAFGGFSRFRIGGQSAAPSPLRFVELGVEHILTGIDHLVFLFGLVLIGGRLRSLLGVITAFTVAHSLTLGLAVLGILAPPPELVEPLIALSIAYVGVENFFVKDAEARWRISAPFGLVHGFGFAGALAQVGVPRADVPLTLLLFNGGVELGQLMVLAVVLPLLGIARAQGALDARAVRALSAAVVGLGLFWLVERVYTAFGASVVA